ncbi:hypothetical protein TNCV_2045401 [Trichonephila clavipes]|uniref:Uncharacterized protein n=1 Tax=Trichonephila clavipes TaxID=2585209 RepID=A0A8X6SZ58_TRICX|nr:hypothetical protein TNCV_2045401 [Trichonephila clavipes]
MRYLGSLIDNKVNGRTLYLQDESEKNTSRGLKNFGYPPTDSETFQCLDSEYKALSRSPTSRRSNTELNLSGFASGFLFQMYSNF